MAEKKTKMVKIPNLMTIVKALDATSMAVKVAIQNFNFLKSTDIDQFIKNLENAERASKAIQKCISGTQELMTTIKDVNTNFGILSIIKFRAKLYRLKKEMNWVLQNFEDLQVIGDHVEKSLDGVKKCMDSVRQFIYSIHEINNKIRLRTVIRFKIKMKGLKGVMNWVLKLFKDLEVDENAENSLNMVTKNINQIQVIIKEIEKVDKKFNLKTVVKFNKKLTSLKKEVSLALKNVHSLRDLGGNNSSIVGGNSSSSNFKSVKDITRDITRDITSELTGDIKGDIKGSIKGRIKGDVKRDVGGTISGSINDSIGSIDTREIAENIVRIKNILLDLKSIIKIINGIKTKSAVLKIGAIRKVMKTIRRLLHIIAHIRVSMATEVKMVRLRTIIASLGYLIASLILITPIMALFILVSPIILICFWAFAKIISFLFKFIRKIISSKIIVGFLVLGIVITLLIATALMLLILVLMVKPLIKNYLNIILFMVLIMSISLVLVGFGLIAAATMPLLLISMIYITILTTTVGLILALAVMLLALQYIKLDAGKIKKNVQQVFDVALYIIRNIFETDANDSSQKSNKGWIGSVIENFLTGVVSIIGAILAVAYLALIFVSIALILAISAMLLLLQTIKLNPDKIKENVRQVFDISLYLIRNIFETGDDKDTEGTKKSWIGAVIENFLTGVVSIIGAILSVAYLALIMVSIALILAIAGMLRLLQEMGLNENKILSNVDAVITTAQHITDTIFDRKDDKNNPSKKSWIRKALEWIGFGPLLQILDAVMAIAYVALVFLCVSLLMALAGLLKAIAAFDIDTNSVSKKVDDIMGAANKVVDEICAPDNEMKKHDNVKVNFFVAALFGREVAEQMAIMGRLNDYIASTQALKKLAGVLVKINEYPDMKGIDTKVETIINAGKKVVEAIFKNNAEPTDWETNMHINSAVSKMEDLGEDMGEYTELLLMAKTVGGDFLTYVVSTALLSKLSDVILNINYFPDLKDIGDKVDNILDAGKRVVDALFGKNHVSVINEKQADAIEDALDALEDLEGQGGEYGELLVMAMAVGGDFLTYVVSTALLSKLANCINTIYYFPDLRDIGDKITHIIDAGTKVVGALFGDHHVSVINEKQADAIENALDTLEDLEGQGGEYGELMAIAMAVGGHFSLYVVSTALLSKLASCINTIYSFPDLEGIDGKVGLIMDAGAKVVNALFGNSGVTEISDNEKDGLENALEAIKDLEGQGGEYGELIAMAMAVGGNFALYVMATALLAQLASCINTINEFPAITNVTEQQGALNNKVDAIINSAKYVVKAVVNEVENGDDKINFFDKHEVEDVLKGYFAAIDGISKLCEGLQKINELPELVDISEKVQAIISGATAVSIIVTGNDPENQLPVLNETQAERTKKTLMAYVDVIDQISKLTKSLEQINRFPSNNKIEENVKSIVKATYAVAAAFETPDESGTTPNPEQLIKRLEPMQKAFNDISTFNNGLDDGKAKVVSKSYVDFINSVNNMKIDRFKNMVDIMKDMTENSEKINKNFEKLAETLEDKVVPSLTSIKSSMDETGKKIDQNGKDNVQALNDVSQGGAVSPKLLAQKGFDQNTQNQAAQTRLKKVQKDRKTNNNWDTLLYLLADDGVKIAR